MGRRVHVVVAEPSPIIRNGLVFLLKKMTSLNIDVAEVSELALLSLQLSKLEPEVLIIDPSHLGLYTIQQLKTESCSANLKTIALQSSLTTSVLLQSYDETISLLDSIDTIKNKLQSLLESQSDAVEAKQELSSREKEVVVCVVKGLTNKQIAEYLFLSAHTVMAHRRNIANKLQIHSSAGLTIYAIVNKLVEINDIKI